MCKREAAADMFICVLLNTGGQGYKAAVLKTRSKTDVSMETHMSGSISERLSRNQEHCCGDVLQ